MAILKNVRLLLALCFLIGAFGASRASDHGPLPPPRAIADHAYAWIGPYGPPTKANRGFRMNLGFVVGPEAVAVIDSGYGPAMAEAIVRHIRTITDRPIRYVINTNSQPHRFMGNPVFRELGARTVAAQAAVPRMMQAGPRFAERIADILGMDPSQVPVPEAPDITVSERQELTLGGAVRITVVPVGHAHTAGSVVVEMEPDGIVYAGDVLYRGRLLALLPDSRLEGWITAYNRLRRYPDSTVFVPGHGDHGALSNFESSTYDYLVGLHRHMAEAVQEWTDLSDAIDGFDQSKWRDLANFDELARRNAHQAYLQLER